MMGQAAWMLATDPDAPRATGVVTPAQAFGMGLVDRLHNLGITFEVV